MPCFKFCPNHIAGNNTLEIYCIRGFLCLNSIDNHREHTIQSHVLPLHLHRNEHDRKWSASRWLEYFPIRLQNFTVTVNQAISIAMPASSLHRHRNLLEWIRPRCILPDRFSVFLGFDPECIYAICSDRQPQRRVWKQGKCIDLDNRLSWVSPSSPTIGLPVAHDVCG